MDWRNVNGTWINFSKLESVYINYLSSSKQYVIKAVEEDDERYELFHEVFSTRKEAQEFLDKFMKSGI